MVDVTVRTEPCLDNEFSLFEYNHKGVSDGFICSDNQVYSEDQGGCTPIEGFPSTTYQQLYGSYICGVRGGLPFKDVVRPENSQSGCPEGYQPCSTKTTAANTVCYLPEDIESSCPITSIEVITQAEYQAYVDTGAYTVQPFTNVYLAFSKSYTNRLPISQTVLMQKPCANWEEGSASLIDHDYYPLEVEQRQECTVDPLTGYRYDDRFIKLGLNIPIFTIETNSGVMGQLETLPSYASYVDNEDKKTVGYELFYRNTVPWKLNCEGLGLDRQHTIEALMNAGKVNPDASFDMITTCACMIAVSAIFVPLYIFTLCGDSNTARVVTVVVITLCQFAVLYFTFGFVLGVGADSEEVQAAVTSMTMVDLCSDAYTKVDTLG